MAVNLVVGIIFLIYSGKVATVTQDALQGTFITNYWSPTDNTAQTVMDVLQSQVDNKLDIFFFLFLS